MSCTPTNTSAPRLNPSGSARSLAAALVGGLLVTAAGLVHAADATTDSKIDFQAMGWASACVTCHGAAQAVEGSTIASLAGTPADELVAKMEAFAAGDVPGSLMQQLARGYDRQTLVRIAQWYEKQGQEAK